MSENERLIHQFYTSFNYRDYKVMQQCYSDVATFNDSVFIGLNSHQTKAMWEMLFKSGKDLQIEFKNISANETNGSAEWIAKYTFSKTGNKVVNKIKAHFIFKNGKIYSHTDSFNFYIWAKQAFGLSGLLLGWTNFMKTKVQQTALNNLNEFMKKHPVD